MAISWRWSGRLTILLSVQATGCSYSYKGLEPKSVPVETRNSVTQFSGDGNALISADFPYEDENGNNQSFKFVCVAPPAQAAVEVRLRDEGKIEGAYQEVKLSASASRELASSIERLHAQNEQTLFVQHVLYRLCEANGNHFLERLPPWLVFSDKIAEARGMAAKYNRQRQLAESERRDLDDRRADRSQRVQDARDKVDEAQRALDAVGRWSQARKKSAEEKREAAKKKHEEEQAKLDKLDKSIERVEAQSVEAAGEAARWDSTAIALEQTARQLTLRGDDLDAYALLLQRLFATATELSRIGVAKREADAKVAGAEQKKAEAAQKAAEAKLKSESLKKAQEAVGAANKRLQDAALKTIEAKAETADCKNKDCKDEEKKD